MSKTDERFEVEESIYSNFDHVLNKSVEESLKNDSSLFSRHPAWNFNARVYFENGKWFSEVWRYHKIVATLEGDSAKEVIDQANLKWGDE